MKKKRVEFFVFFNYTQRDSIKFLMIQILANKLCQCSEIGEKLSVLSSFPPVLHFLNKHPMIVGYISKASLEEELLIKSIIAAGQGERLLIPFSENKIPSLIKQLNPVERFYSSIGGIVGYQALADNLLRRTNHGPSSKPGLTYLPYSGIDLKEKNASIQKSILYGIEALPFMAELYPLGGAADRLKLHDEKSGIPLPAARLPFLGKTLLQCLIEDLQSREYLYYKLFRKQIVTPIAIMTSEEKDNHRHIVDMADEAMWFNRPKDTIRLFKQPMVPVLNQEGEWCLKGPFQFLMKPGGHGVLWQLALEEGIIEWLFSEGRQKALVRQVNNPVASTDYGIIAFIGIGYKQDKWFGFASCPRQVKSSEGINVLIETVKNGRFKYKLTSIEYCDLNLYGIKDEPSSSDHCYSIFPSNTNILFVDLQAALRVLSEHRVLPGLLINLKKLTYYLEDGRKKQEEVARLESTMQNLSDLFEEEFTHPLNEEGKSNLKTYITHYTRRKTISATKREFTLGASLLETPEGCFLDILENNRELLSSHCGFIVPEVSTPLDFFQEGPSFIFLYHPALGPIYSIIGQKLMRGELYHGSELQLQISEIYLENLYLKGSALIQAESVMGHLNSQEWLIYSERCGRAFLKNVTIINKGIDHDLPNVYWRNEISRQEVFQVLLRGNSEFYAENVTFRGDHFIEVPHGKRCHAIETSEGTQLTFENISAPSWQWEYTVTQNHDIDLTFRTVS